MTTTALSAPAHGGVRNAIGDALTLTGRCIRLSRRDADTMVMHGSVEALLGKRPSPDMGTPAVSYHSRRCTSSSATPKSRKI